VTTGTHPIEIITDGAEYRARCLNPVCQWEGINQACHADAVAQGQEHVDAAAAGEI
jgi:hypothetical protein